MKRDKIPADTRWMVLFRDHFRCVYCGATPFDARLEIDHFVPVARGGTNAFYNLVTACQRCNQGKSAEDALDSCPGCLRPMCGGPAGPRDALEAHCKCDCHKCATCGDRNCRGSLTGFGMFCPTLKRPRQTSLFDRTRS